MEDKEFIKLVKEKGLEVALSISAREENKNWLCPVCKSPVKISGQKNYETLSEHVSDPNAEERPLRDAYRCTNKNCICNSEEHDVYWNYNGEMYGGFYIDDEEFIGENNAPFGSFERKLNVESRKCGVKDKTYLHPALCLWLLQPYIEYHYKANVNGDVVKRWFTIEFLKKNERSEYTYGWSTCWRTWSFLYGRFKSQINAYREHREIEILKSAFEPSLNSSWDYRWFNSAMKIFYYKYYRLIK